MRDGACGVERVLTAAGLHSEARDISAPVLRWRRPERKAGLFHTTGAIAVDLESHLVAQAAARAGRPFLILRAIADPASRSLPPAAVNGLDSDGNPALGPHLGVGSRDIPIKSRR